MLPSFLLALREGLEAALILGIALGALRQMRRPDLRPALWAGALCAAAVSLLAGVILFRLGLEFEGAGEQIFEGVTMLLAAGVLTWMIFWMSRQSAHLRADIESGVRLAAGGKALFGLAFLAVVREGVELALFLTAAAFATGATVTVPGALLGLGAAALLGWSLFASTSRLDLRRFFQVTGVLLILFAAGLVALAVHEFNEVGWIPAVIEHVWDLNGVLSEGSLAGQLLKALFGYNGDPSLTEALAYAAYLLIVLAGLGVDRRNPTRLPART